MSQNPPPDPYSPQDSTGAFTPITSTGGVNIASSNGIAPSIPDAPPASFIATATSILETRIGRSNFALIPRAKINDLLDKMWEDSGIQADWTLMQTNPAAMASLTYQINQVVLGQGDDPTLVTDYVALKNSVGVGLTTQEQAALAGATQVLNAPVPKPFGTNKVSGYDYGAPMPKGGWSSKNPGQSFGWDTHKGIDYGTRAGDRIVSPFAGTVSVQTGVPGYGNLVTVTLDNGWKMSFGHVANGAAQDGARVNPGDLIAIAGANVGSAQGSVTIVTWQDPHGNYVNPHEVLDPIFQGTTFSNIGAGGAAGTGMPTVNTLLDREYPTIKSDWQTYFGSPPSPEDVYNVLQHGSSPLEWGDYIRSQPGHIDGMTVGQVYDLRSLADQESTKVLGHPATDGIVKDLYDQQLATPTAVENWYNIHGDTGIPPDTYNKIYKANQPTMKNIFNEDSGFDPRIAKAQGGDYANVPGMPVLK
jgi:murein DD-endopeptidase MepM/ murein hydrolase activator NlpD